MHRVTRFAAQATGFNLGCPACPLPCRLQYHAALGVSRLYLLYDGDDAGVVEALGSLARVEVMMVGGSLAEEAEVVDYGLYLSRHDNNDQWRGRPGNYELMIKQGEAGGEGDTNRLSGRVAGPNPGGRGSRRRI